MVALKLVSRLLFWLLVAYWLIFVSYTIKNFVVGGASAAVAWYRYIDQGLFQWHWGTFLIRQIVILAITLTTWFFGWRPTGGGPRSDGADSRV